MQWVKCLWHVSWKYLFADLRPTTPDRCRLPTNVSPGEERFKKGFEENRISQELLRYLKQQTLMVPRQFRRCNTFRIILIILCIVQTLERTKKQSKFLNYKHQVKSLIPEAKILTHTQESSQISTNSRSIAPNPVQEPPEIIPATPVQAPTQVTAPQALSTMATSSSISNHSLPLWILTPPPTVKLLSPVRKCKRPQSVKFVNYLDSEPKRASRRSRRLHRTSPYKYFQYDND